jgi:predicted ATPase
MLKRLYVDNYKCLVNFEVQFDELTLLLGGNGVGKSSVLDVIFALGRLSSGETKLVDADIFPASTLTRWQTNNKQTVELEIELDGTPMTYRLELEHERKTRRARVALESLRTPQEPLFENRQGEVKLYDDSGKESGSFVMGWSESAVARIIPGRREKLTRFQDFMRKIFVCRIYPGYLRPETPDEDESLSRDGSNFVAWYRHISQERQDLVSTYISSLKEVLDGFDGISLKKVGEETRAFRMLFEEGEKRYELGINEISDGQRALVLLYALVHLTVEQGYTLFLDEPENYVALAEIQPWLLTLADACGKSIPQAVICSRHPELIDYFGVERSLFLTRESSGVVRVRKHKTIVGEGLKLSELIARGWEEEK